MADGYKFSSFTRGGFTFSPIYRPQWLNFLRPSEKNGLQLIFGLCLSQAENHKADCLMIFLLVTPNTKYVIDIIERYLLIAIDESNAESFRATKLPLLNVLRLTVTIFRFFRPRGLSFGHFSVTTINLIETVRKEQQFVLWTLPKPSGKPQGWLPDICLDNTYNLKHVIDITERYHFIAIDESNTESFRATKKSKVLFLKVFLGALLWSPGKKKIANIQDWFDCTMLSIKHFKRPNTTWLV